MNEQLKNLVDNIKNLKSFTETKIFEIIDKELRSVVADMNVEQLNSGIRADGQILPDYSETSVQMYGKPPGPIKLFDSGKFHSSINAKIENEAIQIISTDTKYNEFPANLELYYGSEILGLTDKNIEDLKNGYLIPHLIPKIEKYLE